ncbi:MAG: CPBP family intramembrane metalloprotease [Planctomyces sp.]|nr:CPBP family intramembrane metalloprotease [Planctomyces sp.]
MNQPSPTAGQRGSPWPRRFRLVGKELRETLRDRRTLLTLILMPVLAYPLLGVAFQRLLLTQLSADSRPEYFVAFATEEQARLIERLIEQGRELHRSRERFRRRFEQQSSATDPGDSAAQLSQEPVLHASRPDPGQPPYDVDAHVAMGLVDLGIVLEQRPEFGRDAEAGGLLRLVYVEGSPRSTAAYRYVLDRIEAVNANWLHRVAVESGRPTNVAEVIVTVLPSREAAGAMLASLVPLVLLLMTVTGAVYPSIDLTAGERERHTLETLIAAPVSRLGILLAKYVAVVTVAVLTAGINMAAMLITMQSVGLDAALFGDQGVTVRAIAALFFLLVVFAAFFSAVLLCLTSVARSFKEAQAYLIPLMLVSLAPGVVSLIPGVELSPAYAVVPLLNIVLLARATVLGTASAGLAILVVGSTLLYGMGALSVAARWFGSDAVLAGSSAGWGDLFRRPPEPARPSPDVAAAVFVIVFPLFFVFGSLIGRSAGLSIATRLLLNALLTALLFGAWPWLVAVWKRIPALDAFRLHRAPGLAIAGSLLAGLLTWPLMHEVALAQQAAGISTLGPEQLERVSGILREWNNVPFAAVLLSMAVVPAVFEELSFRGVLFASIARRLSAAGVVIATSCAFGAFHLLVGGSLAVERFLPSTLLGIVLGTIALRSGSVLPGIVFHVAHNGILLAIARYREELQAAGLDMEGRTHLPWWLLVASAGCLAIGLLLVVLSGRSRPDGDAADSANPRSGSGTGAVVGD